MPTLPRFRAARPPLFTLLWVAALTTQLSGQSNRFTVDDVLEVANISVADLSSDGRWIVATSGVPERTSMEMYYALRRLGKEVEWVSYTYGGHGMPTNTVEEVKDYHARILGWYDRFLKGAKKVADQ